MRALTAGLMLLCVTNDFAMTTGATAPTLTVGPDQIVTGMINGNPVRYLMMANGTSTLLLNADTAARLGVKPGLIGIGVRVKIGPTLIDGHTASIQYSVAGQNIKRRVAWFERPVSPDVDGTLGPNAVPQPIITFQLGATQPEERTFELPMVDRGYQGVGALVMVGRSQVFVQWDFTRSTSMATAAAGADFAVANGARFDGPGWQELIRFGVERPVRRLLLASPFTFGPLRIDHVIARTNDYGDTTHVPDPDADENEIVVTASRSKEPVVHHLLIGRDAMAGCSQVTFDKVRRQIVLTCRPT